MKPARFDVSNRVAQRVPVVSKQEEKRKKEEKKEEKVSGRIVWACGPGSRRVTHLIPFEVGSRLFLIGCHHRVPHV